jgi:hypothetical protein
MRETDASPRLQRQNKNPSREKSEIALAAAMLTLAQRWAINNHRASDFPL